MSLGDTVKIITEYISSAMQVSSRILLKRYWRCSEIFCRFATPNSVQKYTGFQPKFTKYEVRLRFENWLKSLWLAPNKWVQMTTDRSLRISGRFLPFWSVNFRGSIVCFLSAKFTQPFRQGDSYYSQRQWHSFSFQINDTSLNNINVCATDKFDKYHVHELDISFETISPSDLDPKDVIIEEATIDKQKAFHNAWVLMIQPLLENMCLEEAKKVYPKFDDLRIDSFHLHIHSKEERLLYYPIYVINYNHRSHANFTCFFDGLTGRIAGDRQYSPLKVTLATFLAFYPMTKIALFSFGSLTNLVLGFEIAAEFSFIASLPMALIIAPSVGLYARSYPKLYRKELSQEQWKRDKLTASKFTYDGAKAVEQKSVDHEQVKELPK